MNQMQKIFFGVSLVLMLAGTIAFAQKHTKSKGVHQYSGNGGGGIPVISHIRAKLKKSAQLQGYESGAGLETFSFNVGTSSYYGDLCDQYSCMIFRPNFGIGYMYRWDRRLSFRAEANYYRLSSKDFYTYRDFSFRSANAEFYLGGIFDLIEFHKRYKKRAKFTPYLFAGIGLTYFNPKANYNGTWYSLEPLKTEGNKYSRVTAIIPFGFGARVKMPKGFDIMLEAGYRKAFSDRIDDVSSHSYQPIGSFSDPVAAALSNRTALGDKYKGYRGNPHKKDGYFIIQLKMCYTPKLRLTSVPRYRHKVGTRTH
jgi:hypothetical protein